LLAAACLIAACSSSHKGLQTVRDRPKLQLGTVELLKIGVAGRAEVWRMLGVPDWRLSPDNTRKTEQWYYFEGDDASTPRLLVAFNPGTWVLHNMVWDVRSDDPESDPQKLLDRYPKDKIESAEGRHIVKTLGATISVDKETGKATMIIWK